MNRQACRLCLVEKWLDQFEFRKDTRRYRTTCRDCRRQQDRAYYQRNRLRKIAASSRYQRINAPKVNIKNRWWRARRREMAKNWGAA